MRGNSRKVGGDVVIGQDAPAIFEDDMADRCVSGYSQAPAGRMIQPEDVADVAADGRPVGYHADMALRM